MSKYLFLRKKFLKCFFTPLEFSYAFSDWYIPPEKVNSILEDKCTSHYRGLWGLNTRKDRKDLAAMIPVDFLLEHCEHKIEV